MPHIISRAATGVNASGGNAITSVFTSGEAVKQGDLIALGADGLAYWSQDPNLPGSALRPIVNATSSAIITNYNVPQYNASNITASPSTGQRANSSCAVLSDGASYVVAWQTSGATPSIQFAIFNGAGVMQGNVVTISTTSGSATYNVAVCALSGGGFAIAYTDAAGMNKVAVYSSAGAVVQAPVSTEQANNCGPWIAPLSNGGFVVTYSTYAASNQFKAVTYSAVGAQVVAPFVVAGAVTNHALAASVCGLVGGGFVVGYVTPSPAVYFSRYNAAGALQGGATVNVITGGAYVLSVLACALAGGGFSVCAFAGTATAGGQLGIYNAAGALQGALTQVDTTLNTAGAMCNLALAPMKDGSLGLAWFGTGGGVKFSLWSAAGGQIGATQTIDASGTGSVALTATSDGGAQLLYTKSSVIWACKLTPQFVPTPITNTITPSAGNLILACLPVANPYNVNLITYVIVSTGSSLFTQHLAAFLQQLTPIGVAIAAAPANTAFPVQVTGVATMRLSFKQPYNLDARGNTVPGQKMSIIGNQAILNGVQA